MMMMVPIMKRFEGGLRSCVENRMMTVLDMMKLSPLAVNAPSTVTGVAGVHINPKSYCQIYSNITIDFWGL